jgi:hypothetical protein
VRDDPLGAAIEPRGNAFHQGRNLRDFHYYFSFTKRRKLNAALARKFHDLD